MADELTRDVDIAHYFPRVVAPSLEFQELAKTENIEFARIWPQAKKWFVNTYVELLDVDGAKRWESMLDIRPGDTDTLTQRKNKILAKINHSLPYTERKFQQMLDQRYGEGVVTLKCDYDNYKLNLEMYDDAGINEGQVYKYARSIIPANLGAIVNAILVMYIKTHHYLSIGITWTGTQRYFSSATGKTSALYWEGTHDKNGVPHTHYFNGQYRHDALEGDTNYKDDQKHFLTASYYSEAVSNLKPVNTAQGKIVGNTVKKVTINHKMFLTDIVSPVSRVTCQSEVMVDTVLNYKQTCSNAEFDNVLDGSWELDGSRELASTTRRKYMLKHTATVTVIKGDTRTEEGL